MTKTFERAFRSTKKAPIFGAFFICLALLINYASVADEWVTVKKVIDGDTFRTESGEKVRLVGINTPELGHDKSEDEPLAKKAARFLVYQIEGKEVGLSFPGEKKDKYGRLLARVKTESGIDVQAEILKQGLAFAIAVGQDLDGLDTLLAAEKEARADDKGVWGYKYFAPITLQRGLPEKTGYARVVGKVKRISDSRKYKTLWMTDRFRVMIPHENWRQFWSREDKQLKGKTIEARGWVFKSKGTGGMKVYHPSMALPIKQ